MIKIEILGTGCPKCQKLAELTATAARELGLECRIDKVTDIQKIITYGVMMTPALVVDGEVKLVGRIPPVEELKVLLK